MRYPLHGKSVFYSHFFIENTICVFQHFWGPFHNEFDHVIDKNEETNVWFSAYKIFSLPVLNFFFQYPIDPIPKQKNTTRHAHNRGFPLYVVTITQCKTACVKMGKFWQLRNGCKTINHLCLPLFDNDIPSWHSGMLLRVRAACWHLPLVNDNLVPLIKSSFLCRRCTRSLIGWHILKPVLQYE